MLHLTFCFYLRHKGNSFLITLYFFVTFFYEIYIFFAPLQNTLQVAIKKRSREA